VIDVWRKRPSIHHSQFSSGGGGEGENTYAVSIDITGDVLLSLYVGVGKVVSMKIKYNAVRSTMYLSTLVKGKARYVRVLTHHILKMCKGSVGITPRIPNMGIICRQVVSFRAQALYPWRPSDRGLGGPQGLCVDKRRTSCPAQNIIPIPRSSSL
jgi:hypothetical protein